jgi:hypothetical protein
MQTPTVVLLSSGFGSSTQVPSFVPTALQVPPKEPLTEAPAAFFTQKLKLHERPTQTASGLVQSAFVMQGASQTLNGKPRSVAQVSGHLQSAIDEQRALAPVVGLQVGPASVPALLEPQAAMQSSGRSEILIGVNPPGPTMRASFSRCRLRVK